MVWKGAGLERSGEGQNHQEALAEVEVRDNSVLDQGAGNRDGEIQSSRGREVSSIILSSDIQNPAFWSLNYRAFQGVHWMPGMGNLILHRRTQFQATSPVSLIGENWVVCFCSVSLMGEISVL